ncbi:MAG: 3-hydroxyacyl-CoA dehydrogenase NAD-binding domain-containing protein [Bacteroidia bacterium]|nr:3-hydroxyacyl-CoA dehydrogenase NAD-binding domain-containing protein [Bacteroidia bacterium]
MIQYTKDSDGIAIISFDNKNSSVNVIDGDLLTDFELNISNAISDASVKGIIITSSKKDFMLGADLKMIIGINEPKKIMAITNRLHAVLRKTETGGKPVVAAINGTALGGGYEVCLACHYRIAVNDPKIQIGLPEVLLGLLPGGGGTQKLPRMIGIQEALPFLLEGKKIRPEQALKSGLVNQLVNTQEELIPAAKQWIATVGKSVQPWDEEGFKIPGGGIQSPKILMVLPAAAGLILKKTYGNYPAPIAIMNCIYEGMQLPFDRALAVECRYFTQCVLSPESKNMIRTLFINMNEANKGEARPAGVAPTNLKKVGILGAGMMGAGIAYVAALNGLNVVLKDVTKEAAEKGKEYSVKLLSEKLSKNQISKEKYDEFLDRIITTDNPADIADCNLVIEAVFENRDLKATVTKESEAVLSSDAVFASNTSTLPITGLAKASARPKNFIGLHFFSPVDKMQLVEIILGEKTSDYAIAMAIDFVKKIKKTPIVVNDGRGFFTSRVFSTYLFEGMECLANGVSPALIENAGKMAGMPVGPLALADEVSIELCYKINKQTELDTGKKRDDAAVAVINKFVDELNRPGKKANKGFYEYPEGGKKTLWSELSKLYPLASQQPDVEEIKKRLLYIQALEAVKCMEENIVTKPADADIGSILGWGFAPYTGGVISFIDTIGLKKFVDECNSLAKKYGKRFKPTRKLKEMAAEGKTFYQEKAVEVLEVL